MISELPANHADYSERASAGVVQAVRTPSSEISEATKVNVQDAAARLAKVREQQLQARPALAAPDDISKELDTGPSDLEKSAATRALAEGLARLSLVRGLQTVQQIALHRQEQAAQLAATSGTEPIAATDTGLGTETMQSASLIETEQSAVSAEEPVTLASAPSQELQVEEAPIVVASLTPDAIPLPGKKPQAPARVRSETSSKPARTTSAPSSESVLSYANPGNPEDDENSAFSGIKKLFSSPSGLGSGHKIAIYDISGATVHMPDGSKLKANSGIGHRMNNPKYAHVKNLGPTPPNVYKLRMRERRFHGVEAIRMLPYDVSAMSGRDGMLAHTPLLRNSKGSHGCVAFLNYNKFLNAFKQGKVETMIVVPNMSALPKYMAMYNERKYASR